MPTCFNTHKRHIFPVFIIVSLFIFSLLQKAPHVYAAPQPSLALLSHSTEFDSNDCTRATIAGKNFTHAGSVALISLDNLTVTPARVSIGSDGNFETHATFCYIGFTGNNSDRLVGVLDFAVAAIDTMTGNIASFMPIAIVDPTPTIRVLSPNVRLLNGCATVKVIGDHFIASGLAHNIVTLLTYKVGDTRTFPDDQLAHQLYRINALGGGNIAISAQYCGLTQGDKFFLLVQDGGSYYVSNTILVETY
jgi:hypothetical protein